MIFFQAVEFPGGNLSKENGEVLALDGEVLAMDGEVLAPDGKVLDIGWWSAGLRMG